MIRVEVTGPPLDIAKDAEKQYRREASRVLGRSATILLREVKQQLRRTTGGEPQEGAPPVKRSGDLARSFRRLRPRVRKNVATSGVKSSHPGAGRLEYGGVDSRGIRTFPHPYLGPAIARVEGEITRMLEDVVK